MLPDSFMHFYYCYAWLKNKGTKTKNTQHTSTIVLFLSNILLFSPFTLFHVVSYPFSPRGVILFSHVLFPGASLDQFTKSPSWEQYNLAKGTIFLVMKSLRGLADATGFTGRIFAKLEKGHFRVNPNPYSFLSGSREGGRASPATPMIPYPLSGPPQIIMCFLNPLSTTHFPNYVFLSISF